MELRYASHLHFIEAIRSGFVTKVLNIDSCGRPGLKFKNVKDLYEIEDKKKIVSSSLQPKNGQGGLLFDRDGVKIERRCLPVAERKTISSDPKTYILNGSGDNDESNSDFDDINLGNMTLKQLRERCKTKKRKFLKFLGATKENVDISSCIKQEYPDVQPEDDEVDLMTPLISWKSKLSKNLIVKKKCMNKHISRMSQSAASVKSEEALNDQDWQSGAELPATTGVPVSASGCSDSTNLIHFAHDSSFHCDERAGSCEVGSSEMLETANSCLSGSGESIYSDEEPQNCIADEVLCESASVKFEEVLNDQGWQSGVELPATTGVLASATGYSDDTNMIRFADDSSFHCDKQARSCGVVSREIIETANACVSGSRESISSHEEPQNCIDDEVLCESVAPKSNCFPDVRTTGGQTINLDNTETRIAQSLPLPSSEFKDCSSDTYDSSLSCSVSNERLCEKNSNAVVQVLNVIIDNSLTCMERSCEDECVVENDSGDALPFALNSDTISSLVSNNSSPQSSHSCSSPNSCLVSVDDGSPITEGNQPPMPVNADAPANCSAVSHVFDANDELTTSAMVGDYHCSTLQHPPERLLSTRKAISPNSQERLCQAMNSIELKQESKGKLFLGKTTENKASITGSALEGPEVNIESKGLAPIYQSEVTDNHEQNIRKPKVDKKGSHSKGILKVSQHSGVLPSLSTGCTSIQSCSENAIAFSHRQMHDIETLALKLMKELKSMKGILEETLHPDACSDTSLKDNLNETRMAVSSAAKVEETARRWLSMMARDCSRFCKIMGAAAAAPPENVIQKGRKKIIFADEVGRMLCHVKLLEEEAASPPLESQSENGQ
ncbi:uncharacterized protein LOC131162554 isoform X2 [Malania oleifera]|uniref:uncharacterized protein LOC131162554 isoform X2 n=1 Tax=Malania oleifera TaxID=397392 RepID=UPI0025AE3EF9|nr:uncharacterized protein LOC131162554 isoform X2 [Malania oleifera]XP_057975147.1 uncharacterized protein LOC131162554 isoform X2 [Malania oleifera]